MRHYILLLLFISIISCRNTNTEIYSPDLAVKIYLLKEYNVLYQGTVDYEPANDRIIEKRYDIKIILKNNSTNVISFWAMSCSWEEIFLINNDYIGYYGRGCDSNYPIIRNILPHDSLLFETSLTRNIKYDNPGKYEIGNQFGGVRTTKLGFILIDSAHCSDYHEYLNIIRDRSLWSRIVWSNPLYLDK